MALKKGDRVEWEQNGEQRYGVVFIGGKHPKVYIDGGEKQIKAPSIVFKISTHPLPADEPSVMDKWTIVSYKNHGNGEETPSFTAQIALNGTIVLVANNHGTGGPNNYHPAGVHKDSRALIDQLEADAKEWGKQFGYPYDFEAQDTWVEWAAREKIYGKLAVDYFKEY